MNRFRQKYFRECVVMCALAISVSCGTSSISDEMSPVNSQEGGQGGYIEGCYIKDPELLRQIEEEYRNPVYSEVPYKSIREMTKLEMAADSNPPNPWGPIHSLEGIECLEGLTDVGITDEPITDIAPLGKLKYLTDFSMGGTRVVDLTIVKELASLRSLALAYVPVPEFDLGLLSGLTELNEISIIEIPVTGSAPLSAGNLETVHFYSSSIEDLSPLAHMSRLRYLRLNCTLVTDLSAVKTLTGLRQLLVSPRDSDPIQIVNLNNAESFRCSGGISDLSPLQDHPSLEILTLSRQNISDIEPLATVKTLRQVDLSGNHIADLEPIAGLPNILHADLAGNQISDVRPLLDHIDTLPFYSRINVLDNPIDCEAAEAVVKTLYVENDTSVFVECPWVTEISLETGHMSFQW